MISRSTLSSVATGLLVLLAALLSSIPPVHGASGPWQATETVEGRLVAAVDGAGSLDSVPIGLHLKMKPGWKTYWRSPGDAGLPPQLAWDGSANLAGTDMRWPAPHRFTLFGIETFGYDGEVVFPIAARPAEPGRPLDLRASVDLLVCSDICVPQRLDLTLAIPEGPASSAGADANLIARFASRVPGDGAASGLSIESVRAADKSLRVVATAREPFVDPDLFVEAGAAAAFGAPKIDFADGDRRITITLPVTGEPVALEGMPVTLTLVDGLRAMERAATVEAPGAIQAGDVGGLAAMLGFALVGGLLLNLMPCVLPVLSLKLLSVVSHGGSAPREIRAGFLASAAGILFSFLVLAGAAVALKLTGSAVGWGIQFQQPLFLVFMVVLVTVFAANLWGLFEIPLPRAIADAAVGGHGGHAPTLRGHFATGALATLLATPCSAPFLGTAVGFALARGPLEIVAVFLALGLGLALPFLAVAAFPRLAARLPRPGRWMIVLRRVLGAALALTGVWLLSVLAVQIGPAAALAVGALMVAVVLALAVRRRLPGRIRFAGGVAAALLALAAFGMPTALDRPASQAAAATDAEWVPFDRAAIAEQVAAGRTVFVDVTASWCITCQANKRLVLARDPVAGRLFGGAVVPMQADWTRPDDGIAAYLAEHGRYGIPFNMVYGPGAPEGIALPELLTEAAVLAALDRAG
ncbi:thioredoxin family protein [Skermanella rosea]|uniref:protein-disulfide reductase DsbD family protein n=1 Tax=Skermanella rosea TaxID=1817965 RepID=UPI0019329F12|nr:protein-disulfide reductase DsbD domain-containing protein [Skermanella rosea]UEM02928.1 thioredoxin family protein [Skermanella rosea]